MISHDFTTHARCLPERADFVLLSQQDKFLLNIQAINRATISPSLTTWIRAGCPGGHKLRDFLAAFSLPPGRYRAIGFGRGEWEVAVMPKDDEHLSVIVDGIQRDGDFLIIDDDRHIVYRSSQVSFAPATASVWWDGTVDYPYHERQTIKINREQDILKTKHAPGADYTYIYEKATDWGMLQQKTVVVPQGAYLEALNAIEDLWWGQLLNAISGSGEYKSPAERLLNALRKGHIEPPADLLKLVSA